MSIGHNPVISASLSSTDQWLFVYIARCEKLMPILIYISDWHPIKMHFPCHHTLHNTVSFSNSNQLRSLFFSAQHLHIIQSFTPLLILLSTSFVIRISSVLSTIILFSGPCLHNIVWTHLFCSWQLICSLIARPSLSYCIACYCHLLSIIVIIILILSVISLLLYNHPTCHILFTLDHSFHSITPTRHCSHFSTTLFIISNQFSHMYNSLLAMFIYFTLKISCMMVLYTVTGASLLNCTMLS